MIITFKELNNKQYELQDERVEVIFNEVKEDMIKILEKYKTSDRELIIASLAMETTAAAVNQSAINNLGSEEIIRITGAKEIL